MNGRHQFCDKLRPRWISILCELMIVWWVLGSTNKNRLQNKSYLLLQVNPFFAWMATVCWKGDPIEARWGVSVFPKLAHFFSDDVYLDKMSIFENVNLTKNLKNRIFS